MPIETNSNSVVTALCKLGTYGDLSPCGSCGGRLRIRFLSLGRGKSPCVRRIADPADGIFPVRSMTHPRGQLTSTGAALCLLLTQSR